MFDTISQQLYVGYTEIHRYTPVGGQSVHSLHPNPISAEKNSKPLPRTVLPERRFPQLAMGCDLNLFWILKLRNGDVLEISMANFIWRFPEMVIFIGFSIMNHPFGGTTIYGNPHMLNIGLLGSSSDIVGSFTPVISGPILLIPRKRENMGYNLHSGMSHQLYIIRLLW